MTTNNGDGQAKDLIFVEVSLRGTIVRVPVSPKTAVREIQEEVVRHQQLPTGGGSTSGPLLPEDVRLMFRGKILDSAALPYCAFQERYARSKRPLRILATGRSASETTGADLALRAGRANHRVKDDLTAEGRAEDTRRRRAGSAVLRKAAARGSSRPAHGFGRIETLRLPDEARARSVLESLAGDPGILACMAKHGWNVGCLAEMYPDGKVGQDPVCVMGLNENRGQRILLRLRTDDLRGFRKILSVRKVLFHELAHNVYSNHGNEFLRLTSQVERECNNMDWRQSKGQRAAAQGEIFCREVSALSMTETFEMGGRRLGGNSTDNSQSMTARDMAALAAVRRMNEGQKDGGSEGLGPSDSKYI